MKHYIVAPLSNSPLLSYCSQSALSQGEVVLIPIKNKTIEGVVWEEIDPPNFVCKEAQSLNKHYLPTQITLATFISQYYCTALGKALSLFVPSPQKTKHLNGLDFKSPFELSTHQKEALEFIKQGDFALLFGETGSGKSEIYIYLAIQSLKEGKTALILMPEIALTPQMQQRLERVFGSCVGIWHSRMSAKKKREVLEAIVEGKIRLVLGARSALFLPIANLGVVIVDEEHDDAYKAQNAPRYNARDLALYLGKKCNIPILLGSATPSATSYFLAQSHQRVFRLKKFFPSHNEIHFIKQKSELTPIIIKNIKTTLEAQKQVIVFLPTRANFKYLVCMECGSSVQCPFCSISMSLHLKSNHLLCHYCGYSQAIPHTCPTCQSPHFTTQRIGTAQIAKELEEIFTEYRIAIFDRDHITTQNKLEKTLKDFAQSKIDILVGTQMLSKGHDYHNIGLAVIMGLDDVLYFGDFRSRERAMSLFFQLKGRVGRKEDGKVILQSLNPDFFDCRDYEKFLKNELEYRKNLYPPFKRLATLTFAHKNSNKAQEDMCNAMNILMNFDGIEVVGGGKAKIEKLNSLYRFIVLLRSSSPSPLLRALRASLPKCDIDIDPLNIV